jgi:6-pyruvoyl-tetrahydropterin synthase
MYSVSGGIFVHFAHHVRGHAGPCISLHGHTWKLAVGARATTLDTSGFVLDFDRLQACVLAPCHALLDHSLALGADGWRETHDTLARLGAHLVGSRRATLGDLGVPPTGLDRALRGARNEYPGAIKVVVFPFEPTSERLAEWLYGVAMDAIADDRVSIAYARVYEALHPTELFAEYRPDPPARA